MTGPVLKFLHEPGTLNGVKLNYFRRRSTTELVASLAMGQDSSLKARADGTVLDGHHRLYILIERGEDVNILPREIMKRDQQNDT